MHLRPGRKKDGFSGKAGISTAFSESFRRFPFFFFFLDCVVTRQITPGSQFCENVQKRGRRSPWDFTVEKRTRPHPADFLARTFYFLSFTNTMITATITMITAGIQIGPSTQIHFQSITCVSFNTIKTIARKPRKVMPPPPLLFPVVVTRFSFLRRRQFWRDLNSLSWLVQLWHHPSGAIRREALATRLILL